MDRRLKDDLLQRIKLEPKLLEKASKKYHLDLDFYREAVSYNIHTFQYVPNEFKCDKKIIDILLQNVSISQLDILYDLLHFSKYVQAEDLKELRIYNCYLFLYKAIYGKEKKIDEKYNLNSIGNNNGLINQINELLIQLDTNEKQFIIYKYGLDDGIIKNKSLLEEQFKNMNLHKYENDILRKIRKNIYNSSLNNNHKK